MERSGQAGPDFCYHVLARPLARGPTASRPKRPQPHFRMTMTPHDSPNTAQPSPPRARRRTGHRYRSGEPDQAVRQPHRRRRHILRRRRRRGVRHTRPQRRGQDYHAGVHRGPDRADVRPHDGAGHGDTPGLRAHPRAHRRSAPGLRLLRPPHAQGDTRTLRPVLRTKRTLRGIARHGGPG